MINIRRATVNDVDSIFTLANRSASKGLMLTRSKYKIVSMLQCFMIAEDKETKAIIGCGALNLLWTDLGEIMTLAVEENSRRHGIGTRIVNALIDEAKQLKLPGILALTYQVDFFKKLGFEISDKNEFPRKLWRECLECPKLEQCDENVMHYKVKL